MKNPAKALCERGGAEALKQLAILVLKPYA